jgi:hypothetical protein
MAGGGWRVVVGTAVLPAAVAGLAGCSGGGGGGAGHPAVAASATAKTASVAGVTAGMLKEALLTHVNGVAAAAPASSGNYTATMQAGTSKRAGSGVQVTPRSCATEAIEGFDPAVLVGAPAAAVTFHVGTNGVSEMLIASTATSARSALAGQVPAGCARYQERVQGKTFTFGVREQPVTGVGAQAKALHVQATGARADNLWSLIYRGAGFVGTVTVVGPNASEAAVQELGQQAYAYATKTLS